MLFEMSFFTRNYAIKTSVSSSFVGH